MADQTDTKIVLMSATLDAKLFANYFRVLEGPEVPIISMSLNRIYKIRTKYLDDLGNKSMDIVNTAVPGISDELLSLAAKKVLDHVGKRESTLVFLPGIYEIRRMQTALGDLFDIESSCLVVILHSAVTAADQRVAFLPATRPKVILSTNIAENSVTIPDVSVVIDFCLTKYVVSNKQSSLSSLKLNWASKMNAEQRAGRTGRVCDGLVYRLVWKEFYNRGLDNYIMPEIQRTPLETVVLRVKLLDVLPPLKFLSHAMDAPSHESIIRAVLILKELGGLQRNSIDASLSERFDPTDGQLTYVGRVMAALPLQVQISKLIILGYTFSVLNEAIVIGACLTVQSIFTKSYRETFEDYTHKLIFADGSGCDFIACLNAYKFWKYMSEQGNFATPGAEEEWCLKYKLDRKSLHEVQLLILEIKARLKELNMKPLKGALMVTWQPNEKPLILKICIAGAFTPNYFISGELTELRESDINKEIGWCDFRNTIYFRCKEKLVHGALYQQQIKQKIVDAGICASTNDMELKFDNFKIFVQFLGDSSQVDREKYSVDSIRENFGSMNAMAAAGKIVPEVYKAVKARILGCRLSINIMADDSDYALDHGLAVETMGIVRTGQNFMKHPEMCVIPSTCTRELTGRVSHTVSCSKFWIQPSSAKESLKTITEDLKEEILESAKQITRTDQLTLFGFVIAYHKCWKRAKVLGVDSAQQTATCYMVDYGETVDLPVGQLCKINDNQKMRDCFDIPERCFEAALSEIAPSYVKCPRGKWTDEAVELFEEVNSENKFQKQVLTFSLLQFISPFQQANFVVYSVHDDIASVELSIRGECINKMLVEQGYARKQEEFYPRKHNHLERARCQGYESRFFDAATEYSRRIDTMTDYKSIPHPPMNECSKQLSLIGPKSPLETTTEGILLSNPGKATIYPDSVNSILLIDDPSNWYGRLTVAANVTKKGDQTILHETTLMPAIPGIGILLGMIFSPEVSFKRNDAKSSYEFARYGLGASPEKLPFFAQHDFILPVTIKLTKEDFAEINSLRFFMSWLLLNAPTEGLTTLSDEDKNDLMSNIKKKILQILSKERPVLPPRFVTDNLMRWPTDDQSDHTRWKRVMYGDGIYPNFPYPPLHKLDTVTAAKLRKAMKELEFDVHW